jgi:regulator of sigma E protease
MEQFLSISSAIIILGILIFVHELGHFLFAKLFRVGVVEFAIGFGRVAYSVKFGETRYTLRLIPLGGFVKMVGEEPAEAQALRDASLAQPSEGAQPGQARLEGDPAAKDEVQGQNQSVVDEEIHPAQLDESRWFSSKPLIQRALIVFAGPLFNLLFAALAGFIALASYGAPQLTDEPLVGMVVPEQAAARAGLQVGDRILSVNGQAIDSWEAFANTVWTSGGAELQIIVQRGAESLTFAVTPTRDKTELDHVFGDSGGETPFRIGVGPSSERVPVSIGAALYGGVQQTFVWCELILRGLYAMITGQISTSNIGGPIQIVQHAAESAQAGVERTLSFMIFLSVSLAVLNLLPIPVLDGGHLFFFLLEAIRGRPVSLRLQIAAQQVGMVALLLLMVFAISNDLQRVFLS